MSGVGARRPIGRRAWLQESVSPRRRSISWMWRTCSIRSTDASCCVRVIDLMMPSSCCRLYLGLHQRTRHRFPVILLKLNCAVHCSMVLQHPLASGRRKTAAARLRNITQNSENVFRRLREQNLPAGSKKSFDSRPTIADYRYAASRRLEQPYARREPGRSHVGAGEVEGVALAAIKFRVGGRREVLDAINILWPIDALGIL